MGFEVHSDERLVEKCGVAAVYDARQTAASFLVHDALDALQHRGQDGSGIASVGPDGKIYRYAGQGLVETVYADIDIEASLPGTMAIGHNRYATSGGGDDSHTQPVYDRASGLVLAHNGNLPNIISLHEDVAATTSTEGLNDSALMTRAIGYALLEGFSLPDAVKEKYPLFDGAFSVVAMNKDGIVAFRDQFGIRPLVIGELPAGGYVVASETVALDALGALFMREVAPGEMVSFDENGMQSHTLAPAQSRLDIFEFVYFADARSELMGRRVGDVRQEMGRQLAEQSPVAADIVVPVPNSARDAAQGYAQRSGITYDGAAITRNQAVKRTFIAGSAQERDELLRQKFLLDPERIAGKRVVLVDDSIVRGPTLTRLVSLVREAGATEVHVRISSPPVKFPDFYGINTPRRSELIAATHSVEEIGDIIGATSLDYLSYHNLITATGFPESCFSTPAFSGEYPIPINTQVYSHAMADEAATVAA